MWNPLGLCFSDYYVSHVLKLVMMWRNALVKISINVNILNSIISEIKNDRTNVWVSIGRIINWQAFHGGGGSL